MQHERKGLGRRLVRAFGVSFAVGAGLALSVAIGSASTGGTAATTATTMTATTTATTTATPSAPSNTQRPTISGTARDGSVLAAQYGTWTGSPTAYAYQWQRCDAGGANCAPIAGANGDHYTLTAADVGHRLRVVVTATNSGGSGQATSDPTAVVQASGAAPANSAAPAISGTPEEGSTLTVSNGTWAGTAPITYSYQWLRCDSAGANCAPIAGATSQSYTLASADVGHTIRANVTAKNARGSSSATAAQTQLVAPGKTAKGGATLSIADVALPDRLIVDRLQFSPNPLRSRTPFTARFHVVDTRGFSISGALVYTVGLPYSYLHAAPEVATDANGWATMTLQPTSKLPLRRGGAIVMFVRARQPGDNLLAGVSTRRLVQERVAG